jgi:hypothetical protein
MLQPVDVSVGRYLLSGVGDNPWLAPRINLTISVPCWTRFEHAAAQLFSMSDEPLMSFSRFYRFESGLAQHLVRFCSLPHRVGRGITLRQLLRERRAQPGQRRIGAADQ